ncbi:hypothetical protein CF326_g3141 [Tilletia indica]|nr:hypothetical protein CF326_g3141 [Tilletia indica]
MTAEIFARPLGYTLGEEIGRGGNARVFRGFKTCDQEGQAGDSVAAIKYIAYRRIIPRLPSSGTLGDLPYPNAGITGSPTADVRALTPRRQPLDFRALEKEVCIHRILRHDSIVRFLGAEEVGVPEERSPAAAAAAAAAPGLYIVLELAPEGDLFNKIPPDQGLDENTAKGYSRQLHDGLVYLHRHGVAHRDIKAENLLIGADGRLKISDFGCCTIYRYQGKERVLHGPCGTIPYMPPESLVQGYRGEAFDVWSAGIILFTLLSGALPWTVASSDRSRGYRFWEAGELIFVEPWNEFSLGALALLRGMLAVEEEDRFDFERVGRHPWVVG